LAQAYYPKLSCKDLCGYRARSGTSLVLAHSHHVFDLLFKDHTNAAQ